MCPIAAETGPDRFGCAVTAGRALSPGGLGIQAALQILPESASRTERNPDCWGEGGEPHRPSRHRDDVNDPKDIGEDGTAHATGIHRLTALFAIDICICSRGSLAPVSPPEAAWVEPSRNRCLRSSRLGSGPFCLLDEKSKKNRRTRLGV